MKSALTTAKEWKRFTADLALCLGDLDEDEFLILSHKRINYFVQFAAQGKFGMRAEAACNNFIEPIPALLTTDDYERLTELGWHKATNPPPKKGEPEPPDGSPNFFVDAAAPVNFKALAVMTTHTFQDVYRVRHPGSLEYKAFAKDETQIRFPTLRLKRA